MKIDLMQNIYFFLSIGGFILSTALGVLFSSKPINALLYLVLSMLGVGVLFIVQGAVFLGAVQFAVYAGAVMVLMLMIFMLMDVDRKSSFFFDKKPSVSHFIKIGSVGAFLGLSMGALSLKTYTKSFEEEAGAMEITRELSITLFKDHLLLFEVIGLFLLVIAVGVVAVSKFRGGSNDGV